MAFADFPQIELVPVSDDELTAPVAIRNANDGTDRLFVVDQRGLIQIIDNGRLRPTPFLDIESKLVEIREGFDERGLLSLAFHPNYSKTGQPGFGKFYVYYSGPSPNSGTVNDPVDHQSVVAEYAVSGDPNVADEMSERVLLTFDQPQFNHNGGDLAFGPQDGLLYISTGDGGGSNDDKAGHTGGSGGGSAAALGNAQDTTNLLGKILRIDPLGSNGPGGEYGIPASNPFVGNGGGVREEIFAYGLRNPWRMCFDTRPGGTDSLFVADVGQGKVEEINVVENGDNLGWRNREGSVAFATNASGTGPFVDPILEYAHRGSPVGNLSEIGLSITGGYFYQGGRFPSLEGKYIFGDWSNSFGTPNGTLLGMEERSPGNFSLSILDVIGGNPIGEYITAFGIGEDGEIYVATRKVALPITDPETGEETGKIYRVQPAFEKTTVVFEAAKDNTLFSEEEGTGEAESNGKGEWIFAGKTNNTGDTRRALLAFDVATALPADAIVTNTTLQLAFDMARPGSGNFDVDLHRLTSDWGEGESDAFGEEGGGALATLNDATWIYSFYDTELWGNPGGDFDSTSSATTRVNEIIVNSEDGFDHYQWSAPRLADDVQSWIDGVETNYGWILLTHDPTKGNARRFKSRESPSIDNRPKLFVTYVIDDFVDTSISTTAPRAPAFPALELAKVSKQIKKAKKALKKHKKSGNSSKAAKIKKKLKKLKKKKRELLL